MMPVWQSAVKDLVKEKKLTVIGVIQEQHAERCRLYAQWKKIDWPIIQDQMTVLGADKVPMAVLIDESGIVRGHMGFRRGTKLSPRTIKELVATEFEKPADLPQSITQMGFLERTTSRQPPNPDVAVDWLDNGDLLMMAGKVDTGLALYQKAAEIVKKNPDSVDKFTKATLHFRLGVAYRARHDSKNAEANDFENAVKNWTVALDAVPNQYIWRRRIEQYGPMQIKPYPFYDWVEKAITEIKDRGEKPIELKIALTKSEVANPRAKQTRTTDVENPDANGKIERDNKLVGVTGIVVPAHVRPGKIARVHLQFQPAKGKWNNESKPMMVWIDEETQTNARLIRFPNPKTAESNEVRGIEFEVTTPKTGGEEYEVKGFALYNVCDNETGQCLYRRQDFSVTIPLKK